MASAGRIVRPPAGPPARCPPLDDDLPSFHRRPFRAGTTAADPRLIRWIFQRIRRDARRRYYVALSLAWLGSLAGATLLILPVFAGVSFAMRGMLSASAASGVAGTVCGVIAVHVGYAIETALMTLQLKPEIAARLARDRLPAA